MRNKKNWCIVTITLVRSREEDELLRASLPFLSTLGVPVVITDGGSPGDFLQFVRSLPNVRLLAAPAKGLWAQAKNSLTHAADTAAPLVLYTEPDKKDFFAHGLDPFLAQAEALQQAGVVMAARNTGAFNSFPAFQQLTETTINNCCKEVIGLDTDYCYGPFLLPTKLVSFLHTLPDDIGWGWRPFVFGAAHRLGYGAKAIEGDFYCPAAQRKDTPPERIYRMKQLEQNIRGLVLSTASTLS